MYDLVAGTVSLGLWKEWVLAVLPYIRSNQVLEIGHGPGHLQIALQQKGLVAFGLDISLEMGRLAERNIVRCGMVFRLVNGYAQCLPFSNNSFETVVATFPTEFIMDINTLQDIQRVLVPGGELLVLPVAWITGKRWFEKAAAGLFQITGQAPEWEERALEPARQAGFLTEVEKHKVKSSQVLIVHAVKPRL